MATVSPFTAPGDGEVSSDQFRTSPRWTAREPRNVATVSQFAAPSDGEVLFDLNRTSFRWTSQEPTNAARVSQLADHSGGEVSSDVDRQHSAGPRRSPRTWRQSRCSHPSATARSHLI